MTIMLTVDQIPVGAMAHVYLLGQEGPFQTNGSPDLVRMIEAGKNKTPILHVLREGKYKPISPTRINESARFSPINVYSSDEAPVGGKYAVFNNGKRIKIDHGSGFSILEVAKGYEGQFVRSNLFPFVEPLRGSRISKSDLERYASSSRDELLIELSKLHEDSSLSKSKMEEIYSEIQEKSRERASSGRSQVEGFLLQDRYGREKARLRMMQCKALRIVDQIVGDYRNSPADLIRSLESHEELRGVLYPYSLRWDDQLVRVDEE